MSRPTRDNAISFLLAQRPRRYQRFSPDAAVTLRELGDSKSGPLLHRIPDFSSPERLKPSHEALDPVPDDLRRAYPTVFPSVFSGGCASMEAHAWWDAFGNLPSWRWAEQAFGIGWSFDTVKYGRFPNAHFLRDEVKTNHASCYAPGVADKIDDMVRVRELLLIRTFWAEQAQN